MITLCDLTFLLLGFLVVWYVSDKKHIVAQVKPRVIAAETPKTAQLTAGTKDALDLGGWLAVRDDIERHIDDLHLKGDIRVQAAHNEILISLKETVPFASGKADLRPAVLPVIEKVAAIALTQGTLQLEIRGHTDNRPISTAEFPSNWELSAARASRVARYLIEKGVPPSRITVQGFASQRPSYPAAGAAGRSVNRRVEIRLYQKGK